MILSLQFPILFDSAMNSLSACNHIYFHLVKTHRHRLVPLPTPFVNYWNFNDSIVICFPHLSTKMSVATFLKIKGVFFLKHFSGVTNVRLGQHGQLNASLGNVNWIGLRSGDTLESSVFESTSHMFGKSGRVFNEFSLLPFHILIWIALPDTVSVPPNAKFSNNKRTQRYSSVVI